MNKMKSGRNHNTDDALKELRDPSLPTKKLQMNVPEDLHRRFKRTCQNQELEMTQVTIDLIQKWMASQPQA